MSDYWEQKAKNNPDAGPPGPPQPPMVGVPGHRTERDEALRTTANFDAKERLYTEDAMRELHAEKAALEAQVRELRLQLRYAWARLGCRCIFNDAHEKEVEDSHCPVHGVYERPDEISERLKALQDSSKEGEA